MLKRAQPGRHGAQIRLQLPVFLQTIPEPQVVGLFVQGLGGLGQLLGGRVLQHN